MNNDECTALLFRHNRLSGRAGTPSPVAALGFSTLRPDLKA
jgi:hypothetical protein